MSELEELQKSTLECAACILYTPAKDEVDYGDISFPIKIADINILIPRYKNSDPFSWATDCTRKFKNMDIYVLVPGTKFDLHGTRHGRGAGWYDRFLSKVPSTWLRIGIVDKSKFSNSKLLRQHWDQPVDWVIVQNGLSWNTYKTSARI